MQSSFFTRCSAPMNLTECMMHELQIETATSGWWAVYFWKQYTRGYLNEVTRRWSVSVQCAITPCRFSVEALLVSSASQRLFWREH